MEKYFEMLDIINEKHIDITKLYILSCCSMDTQELDWEVMNYVYDLWLDADIDLDLARLTSIVCDRWKDIQNEEVTDTEIIEDCACY